MSFHQLELHDKLVSTVAELGYEIATPVQVQAIPPIMAGNDLKGSAQTGTGKTAAFVLPALHMLLTRPAKNTVKGPRVLIVVPTRELAMQVAQACRTYSKNLNEINSVCICGGMGYTVQNRLLAKPYDILIATPGRLLDMTNQRRINLSGVEMFILDEADRMLDMGFIGPVTEIAEKTPKNRQTLLFSATLSKSVERLADQLLNNPVQITVSHQTERNLNIEQRIIYADGLEHKKKLLTHLLDNEVIERGIIFTSTKRFADELGSTLTRDGYSITTLHGDMPQRSRTRAINHLRDGKATLLVATDVAARGIDIPTISHVINFDLPTVPEDYVHRIGRTGRAGATGQAFTLATRRDHMLLERVQKFTGQKIEALTIAGLEGSAKAPNFDRPSKDRDRARGRVSGRGQSSTRGRVASKGRISSKGRGGARDGVHGKSRASASDEDRSWGPARGKAPNKKSFSSKSSGGARGGTHGKSRPSANDEDRGWGPPRGRGPVRSKAQGGARGGVHGKSRPSANDEDRGWGPVRGKASKERSFSSKTKRPSASKKPGGFKKKKAQPSLGGRRHKNASRGKSRSR